ncbi:hypothetical protein [Streptacidiphilus carbonis]|uniref:hypothetical protein n=1 Tax=Streptacidiphilus carbonis TaxID=105422 RepID=UPI000694D0B0|nr:hypothetical protein [Streptacidiphilus carbonis]
MGDGAVRLRALAITGIVTVLITRAFLAATGYPQVGGGGLHIAHVLWGGLLMLAGLGVALTRGGAGARTWTVLLGGVGAGLFADEIGKYLTQTNDYFYRPAAALIYFLFASLLVLAALLQRQGPGDPEARITAAARIAAESLHGGLTDRQRHCAAELLDGLPVGPGPDDERAAAVHALLALAPSRPPGRAERLGESATALAARVTAWRWTEPVAVSTMTVSHVVVAIVFLTQIGNGGTVIPTEAAVRVVTALLVLAGLRLRFAGSPQARRLWRAAVLIDLLIVQVLNFDDSQFRAVGELPYQLLLLGWLSVGRSAASGRSRSPQGRSPLIENRSGEGTAT